MKLLVALIMTSVILAIAAAGWNLIASNARVVAKHDRTKLLEQTRFQLKEYVACRATEKAICEGGRSAPAFKSNGPSLQGVRFLSQKKPLPKTGNMVLTLRARCLSYGVSFEYVYNNAGKPALDPVSRLPTKWRPLFDGPLCSRGHVAAQ